MGCVGRSGEPPLINQFQSTKLGAQRPAQVTPLPDSFNWKPYWGEGSAVRPAPLFPQTPPAEVGREGLSARSGFPPGLVLRTRGAQQERS